MNKSSKKSQDNNPVCIDETSISLTFKSVLKANENKKLNIHFLNQLQTHFQHTKMFLNSKDVHQCSSLIIDVAFELRVRRRPTVIIVPRLQYKYLSCRYKLYGLRYTKNDLNSIDDLLKIVETKSINKSRNDYTLSDQFLKLNENIFNIRLHKNSIILEVFYKVY